MKFHGAPLGLYVHGIDFHLMYHSFPQTLNEIFIDKDFRMKDQEMKAMIFL
jgi:hypothetical protein